MQIKLMRGALHWCVLTGAGPSQVPLTRMEYAGDAREGCQPNRFPKTGEPACSTFQPKKS